MILVSSGQSLLDVCLQELGGVAAFFDLADANGLTLTDALAPGQQLAIPASDKARPDLAALFTARAYRVNTGADSIPTNRPLPVVDFTAADFDSTDYLTA